MTNPIDHRVTGATSEGSYPSSFWLRDLPPPGAGLVTLTSIMVYEPDAKSSVCDPCTVNSVLPAHTFARRWSAIAPMPLGHFSRRNSLRPN